MPEAFVVLELCAWLWPLSREPSSTKAVRAVRFHLQLSESHARARARPGRPVRKSDWCQVLGSHCG